MQFGPRMQNIPLNTVEAKVVREALAKQFDMVKVDFAQIEKRVLAQMAK